MNCAKTENEGLRSAIERVKESGAELRFFDFTGAIRVPTIGCFLRTAMPESRDSQVQLTAGFACRPDPSEAALAALLEAVQSRLTDEATNLYPAWSADGSQVTFASNRIGSFNVYQCISHF